MTTKPDQITPKQLAERIANGERYEIVKSDETPTPLTDEIFREGEEQGKSAKWMLGYMLAHARSLEHDLTAAKADTDGLRTQLEAANARVAELLRAADEAHKAYKAASSRAEVATQSALMMEGERDQPTQEMYDACNTVIQGYGAKLVWQRMYNAAPAAPSDGEKA